MTLTLNLFDPGLVGLADVPRGLGFSEVAATQPGATALERPVLG